MGRIESAQVRDPSMGTMRRLLEATGHRLVAVDAHGTPLGIHPDEDKCDRGARAFPAHLEVVPVNDPFDLCAPVYWWGWGRVAWWPDDKAVPRWTFVRARPVRAPPSRTCG